MDTLLKNVSWIKILPYLLAYLDSGQVPYNCLYGECLLFIGVKRFSYYYHEALFLRVSLTCNSYLTSQPDRPNSIQITSIEWKLTFTLTTNHSIPYLFFGLWILSKISF